jgi:hypothetical protein
LTYSLHYANLALSSQLKGRDTMNQKEMDLTKPAHTQTPWRIAEDTLHVIAGIAEKEVRVVTVDGSVDDYETDKANTAFIVKCVNSHEELLAMLKRLKPFIEHSEDPHFRGFHLDELIAKAEGK